MASPQPKMKQEASGSGPAADTGAQPMRWGAAALLLTSVLLAARLALPQPIGPTEVPFPRVDAQSFEVEQARRAELLSDVRVAGLPQDSRAIGELVRRIGRAEYQRDFDETQYLAAALTKLVRTHLRAQRESELSRLRALQAALLADALLGWDGHTPPTSEQIELAGGLLHRLSDAWGGGVVLVREELEATSRVRWTTLLGLQHHLHFAPLVNDTRLSARLQLRLAEHQDPADRRRTELSVVESVAEVDGDYPKLLASGVVHFRAGDYPRAFENFTQHLRKHDDGPWRLRAQNYATAAAEQLVEQQ